jgi:uridylate kinase
MRVVLRIGGSVVASPINSELINKYADLLINAKEQGHEVAAIVGGGGLAREFILAAKNLGLREKDQDEIAISTSRLFAQLFLKKLGGKGCVEVPFTIDQASSCVEAGKIVVMGGLKPGMTTDTVAALVADRLKANLIVKGTDQEGIYNKDPRKFLDAVKLDRIPLIELSGILSENKHKAGIHQIIDPEAVKILNRIKVKLVVVNGFNPENVQAAINGNDVGTTIE